MNFDYLAVENAIGYRFSDKNLLLKAFTHSSFANENKGFISYERLEFLGDSVLGFLVAERLYSTDENAEGDLTVKKSELVSTVPLSEAAEDLGLDKYILFGKGVTDKDNQKYKEDVFEALTAAIYLDGGYAEVRRFIDRSLLRSDLLERSFSQNVDHKSLIKVYAEKNKLGQVEYVLTDRSGPDHSPTFKVTLYLGGKALSEGLGQSKKTAERRAAEAAVYKLKSEGHNIEF